MTHNKRQTIKLVFKICVCVSIHTLQTIHCIQYTTYNTMHTYCFMDIVDITHKYMNAIDTLHMHKYSNVYGRSYTLIHMYTDVHMHYLASWHVMPNHTKPHNTHRGCKKNSRDPMSGLHRRQSLPPLCHCGVLRVQRPEHVGPRRGRPALARPGAPGAQGGQEVILEPEAGVLQRGARGGVGSPLTFGLLSPKHSGVSHLAFFF